MKSKEFTISSIMSGAAGLAAAKRRRATAQPPSSSSSNVSRSASAPKAQTRAPAIAAKQEISSGPKPIIADENGPKTSPLQTLRQHDTRLTTLEGKQVQPESVDKLKHQIDELKQTILKIQTFAIESSLEVTKLKKEVVALKSEASKSEASKSEASKSEE